MSITRGRKKGSSIRFIAGEKKPDGEQRSVDRKAGREETPTTRSWEDDQVAAGVAGGIEAGVWGGRIERRSSVAGKQTSGRREGQRFQQRRRSTALTGLKPRHLRRSEEEVLLDLNETGGGAYVHGTGDF